MKKYAVGYTQGVFDMFHIGHLNLLNNAKQYCDYLIVGVNSDKLVQEYKQKKPVISEHERKAIVENIKAVDECFIVDSLDKAQIYEKHPFDAVFIGDDWKGNERWKKTEQYLSVFGAEVCYLPYTKGVCSTVLRESESEKIKE